MNVRALTTNEKQVEAFRRLRTVIDNKNLRDRQQRVYEILNTFNIELGDNMKALLKGAGLKWQ